ncbi:MAG: c-type cytochrome biogenesis protein CcsB [Proteobacteria bacterium]|nr:c-type cytochrome biogenesis protein CcsB [Pseudomonadota bacterium]
MDILFFKIALCAYLVSTLGYITSLLIKRVLIARASTWVLFGAFIVHAASFLFRCIETGHSPFVNLYESLSFFAWAVSGIYLAFQVKTKTRVLGAFVSPVAFLLMMVASVRLGGDVSMPAILQGHWVTVHVIFSISGEALFALACLAGVMYLIQDGFIKSKKIGGFSRLLPSLRDLDRINHICLLWGFPLLTVGVIAGSIWARTVWGSHWQWDTKQIWTLIVWAFYAVLLHQRLAIGWKGKKAAFFSIVAFLILLFAFVGANVFFATSHRFI